jgi:hypothetical protein
MNRVPFGRNSGRALDPGNQALDLQSGIVLRVAGDEVADCMQIAPRLR